MEENKKDEKFQKLKKEFSEADIRTKYISPAIHTAGWDVMQYREEYPTQEPKIIPIGNEGKREKKEDRFFADYVLYYKDILSKPIAVVEAKDNNHTLRAGMSQAKKYAETLGDLPCYFSSNGDGFIEFDKTMSNGVLEREISLNEFPSPQELWRRYAIYKGLDTEIKKKITLSAGIPDSKSGGKVPRYYQQVAIDKAIEAVAQNQKRILLVMATGTGKTYVAAQIAWKLFNSGTKKRILFLADRNCLIEQTKRGDFSCFGEKMTIIRKKKIDKAYNVYLALYQGLTNYDEDKDAYREFSPDFFDLIIIDECHRGSIRDDAEWRKIIDYFNSATHIGLTATPIETKKVSNKKYFSEPVFKYSLRRGIEDGYLAPYKVYRIQLDVDQGWSPEDGQTDTEGQLIPDKEYNVLDRDRIIE